VATGAQVLARCKASRRPPMLVVLDDGSYLTRIAGLKLRVIEARVKVTGSDGSPQIHELVLFCLPVGV
jgi:hypothetical protein